MHQKKLKADKLFSSEPDEHHSCSLWQTYAQPALNGLQKWWFNWQLCFNTLYPFIWKIFSLKINVIVPASPHCKRDCPLSVAIV